MTLVVVGSIAFDAVKTPFGERGRMLGGSAVHFSLAASFFCPVRVVGPVGDDFGDDEVRMFSQEPNLVRAARKAMGMGPGVVVAKQGEYGAALFVGDRFFALPAFPLEDVQDPTGAGDSFAGGFFGYLAAQGTDALADQAELRRAMTYGSVLASFNVEEFGTERMRRLTRQEIDERYSELRRMTALAELPA